MKKNLKKKITKVLAISMAFSMIFSSNAFATPIDLVNSTESVVTDTLTKTEGTDHFTDEDTNVWNNGEIVEEVRVSVQRESEFIVTIPKDIVLDGETGKADYVVNAKGDISGEQVLKIVPNAEFELAEAGGKDSVTATVTQDDTDYTYVEMQGDGTNYPGNIKATLTAGEWTGKFVFNISFNGGKADEGGSSELPEVKATLNDYTWEEIDAISKSGEAQSAYGLKVGDIKEITLSNGETYNVEIIGFNHDNLADRSGTAGITFQFKELMNTAHVMNTANTNVGGWEASEMRTYVNEDVYALLPSELQAEIKEVTKISDVGNKNTTDKVETTDKLFLLSFEEVGFTSNNTSYFVAGQGTKYKIYNDNESRIKKNLSDSAIITWWLRSARTNNANYFSDVISSGDSSYSNADITRGVAPAFCI